MAKILTLTLNPALDITISLDRLRPGASTAARPSTAMPPARG